MLDVFQEAMASGTVLGSSFYHCQYCLKLSQKMSALKFDLF
jgi:hypothetical protein